MSARRVALLVALVLGAALAAVLLLTTPGQLLPVPAGGATPVDAAADFSAAQIQRGDDFAAAIRPASLVSLLLGLAVSALLGLTRLGGRLVRAVAPARTSDPTGAAPRGGWVWQVLLGTVAVVVLGRLATLPVGVWAEVVRRRYGLSTRSWGLWLRDVATSTAITAVVTALALVALVALVRRAPRTWWAWAGAGAAGLVVVGSFLYPVLVEPAFNDFTSMPAGQLRTDLLELAEESGTPVQDVLVADASRRTTALNAYVSGFGSTRRIVVYDTLLEQVSVAEVESVVAHELGHVAADDVLTGTAEGALGAAAAMAGLGWLLSWTPLLRRVGADGPGDPRVVPLLLFLVAAATLVSTPVQNGVSRQVEARADLHALDLTRDPDAFIGLQRQLATANLADLDPPAAWQWFFGSHPTSAQRIAFARDWQRDRQG
ncbi:M48 family metalloprotease [Modestobacter sp. I12A-02628]|uniref:M48 family metalloprotease n=1 Tax=Goekera deserti TaxID=2497753 RepID=A0A7K3WAJ9_9ACTN|nr:M48 family metalloprotease [Goekera deserti]MPQ97663.1 M48 family metalloprotease [Goekera deserti]NDI47733.1 M48 family metalloprotease [Goekera deserti]NEL53481.1 M48 family metalloprotease [Goekera deserti]